MISNLLFEDNKNIESLIDHLNSKIVELRKRKLLEKGDELFETLENMYKNIINPWIKEYSLSNKELERDEEQEFIDIILDTINTINKILE